VKGTWKATHYNTMTGEVEDIQQNIKGNVTEIYYNMYAYDSLLLWLEPATTDKVEKEDIVWDEISSENEKQLTLPETVSYTLSEPNVLLLDMAEYALDDGEWQPKEELLRADLACRRILGWNTDIGHVAQPWSLGEETEFHTVRLGWNIESEVEVDGIALAAENVLSITWNGENVPVNEIGWYVDKAIKKIALPKMLKGTNRLEIVVPIGKRTTVEWAYLLGDFGVHVFGKNAKVTAKPETLAFGNVVNQGFPFYTGNITYHLPITTEGGNVKLRSGYYIGGMQDASIDGTEAIPMVYPPYKVNFGTLSAGEHVIDLTLYGTRFNGFGPIHLADEKEVYPGPSAWRKQGDRWCYEYRLREMGIITSPEVTEE